MGFEVIPFKHSSDVLSCLPDIYSKNLQWFTTTPKYTTVRINTIKFSPEQVVQNIKMKLTEESAKLGVAKQPNVHNHNIINECLVIGPWENLDPQSFVDSSGDVIVDVACGNAVLRGAHIFAPGVLALSNRVCEGDTVDIYVDIFGKCLRGYLKKFFGEKVYIGKGLVKINRNKLFSNNAKVNGIAIEVIYRTSKVPSITLDLEYGLLQNLPSIMCSYVLEPTSDSEVLDMCAAPGNKTSHIATLMNNMGRIIALDKSEQKVAKIISLNNKLGITNTSAFVWDSTKALSNGNEECSVTSAGPPFSKSSFNRILLDAPCSALGQRPNLYNKITLKQLKSYVSLQKNLLRNAVELLKPGGILVYSTCTITIEENENLVKWALNKYNNLKLKKSQPYFGSPGLAESHLSDFERGLVQRFGLPPGDNPDSDTIGFFIAKFVKDSL